MDADLDATKLGPGVRPPGRLEKPIGLWLPGHAPSSEVIAAHYDVRRLDELPLGEELTRSNETGKAASNNATTACAHLLDRTRPPSLRSAANLVIRAERKRRVCHHPP
jgi:hypothetical protein